MFLRTSELESAPKTISRKCGFEEVDFVDLACGEFHDDEGVDTCILTPNTVINATNFVIGDLRDEKIGGIYFFNNEGIEYLPYKVYMQLPHLVKYYGRACAVKQISRENFEKLTRLRSINLSFNQIQKISGNTFEGLENLRVVDLG